MMKRLPFVFYGEITTWINRIRNAIIAVQPT